MNFDEFLLKHSSKFNPEYSNFVNKNEIQILFECLEFESKFKKLMLN